MSNHSTIAALKAVLESERDELIANRESWLLECNCDPSSEFYEGGTCYYHLSESEKHKQNFNAGHEAATERLMAIVEMQVEIIEGLMKTSREQADDYVYVEYGFYYWKEKAREFLTILADASGDK